jgi:hypothetical protein
MDNLDEKHVDLLRTNLSVYEVDGIQCQLTFQKQTITLEVKSIHYPILSSFSFHSSPLIAVHVHLNMIKIKLHYISRNIFVNLIILILLVN